MTGDVALAGTVKLTESFLLWNSTQVSSKQTKHNNWLPNMPCITVIYTRNMNKFGSVNLDFSPRFQTFWHEDQGSSQENEW